MPTTRRNCRAKSPGYDAGVTFDGAHYIIVAAQHEAGVWRYVEP